ncbi:hypothetical protein [Vibrio azureus]|uniref:Uncharacterized protein n=1 Tax=Vibrio azureus NBRC 104587 TaxID=1219077 RepID=U3A3U2_9VIBR|nr:hypothetical protein [Vibrio azureus]GAD74676.1 hypothetical protein VAZ01S_013_00830 [Vibrio azureus NBRC 104587]
MKQNILKVAIVTALGLCHSSANSMPDTTKGDPLSKLGIELPSSIGNVVPDHENRNTLHVGPANVKEIKGDYTELDSSGAMCSDYLNMRRQTYTMPLTAEEKQRASDNGEYISNYFQITYSIANQNTDMLNIIKENRAKVRAAGLENRDRIAKFKSLESLWFEYTQEKSEIENDLKDIETKRNGEFLSLTSEKSNKITNCVSANTSDTTKMLSCIQDANSEYSSKLSALNAKYDNRINSLSSNLSEVKRNKDSIRGEYYAEKAYQEANAQELELIQDDIKFASAIVKAQQDVVKFSFNIEKETLKEEESKIVGRATAGYNLYHNEAKDLKNILAKSGKSYFDVKQLEVFNIRLNSGVTVDNFKVKSSGVPLYHQNVITYPADTLVKKDALDVWEMPFERLESDERPKQLSFKAMDEKAFGSGGFVFYVTKGARCGEYKHSMETSYSSSSGSSKPVSWTVEESYYQPLDNQVVFTQPVGLSYSYYAYPGKVSGFCTINVDRMNSYWRNAGSSRRWSWFRTKTKSWDEVKTTARDNMGMHCSLKVKPQGANPSESREMADSFELQMYNDMWQMFLAVYAEEYKVEVVDKDNPELETSSVGNDIAKGVMGICPQNLFCQIGGVVLKTLDSLGGGKAQGTTSSTSTQYGTIRKSFNKDSYVINEGSALINVKVCIDKNRCD